MQLLKFELYKIFKQKSVWIALIVLLGMSYLSLDYPYNSDLEKALYKEWNGPITEEKVQQAKTEYTKLRKIEQQHRNNEEDMEPQNVLKIWLYQKIILAKEVKENIQNKLDEIGNKADYKTSMEKEMLSKIRVTQLSYHTGPGQIVSFVEFGSAIVTGIMLLIGLAPIYSNEYSSGVDNYIFSSTKGRRPLAWAKIGASVLYALFVVLAWEMFNLGVNLVLHGSEGWATPMQLVTLYTKTPYANSPYAFNLLHYHLIQLGIHLTAALSFALLIVFISSMSKSSLITFFIGGFVFGAPIVLNGVQWLNTILTFSYTSIMRVQFLFDEFKTIDIFGYPVLYPVFAVILMIILSMIVIRMTLQIIKRKEVTS